MLNTRTGRFEVSFGSISEFFATTQNAPLVKDVCSVKIKDKGSCKKNMLFLQETTQISTLVVCNDYLQQGMYHMYEKSFFFANSPTQAG